MFIEDEVPIIIMLEFMKLMLHTSLMASFSEGVRFSNLVKVNYFSENRKKGYPENELTTFI